MRTFTSVHTLCMCLPACVYIKILQHDMLGVHVHECEKSVCTQHGSISGLI